MTQASETIERMHNFCGFQKLNLWPR